MRHKLTLASGPIFTYIVRWMYDGQLEDTYQEVRTATGGTYREVRTATGGTYQEVRIATGGTYLSWKPRIKRYAQQWKVRTATEHVSRGTYSYWRIGTGGTRTRIRRCLQLFKDTSGGTYGSCKTRTKRYVQLQRRELQIQTVSQMELVLRIMVAQSMGP